MLSAREPNGARLSVILFEALFTNLATIYFSSGERHVKFTYLRDGRFDHSLSRT